MPAVSTLINVVEHMTTSNTNAATVSAMMWSRRWALVRRKVVGQRTHWAVMPGAKAGTVCNNPQPGHSRSCGSVIGRSRADRITAPVDEHRRDAVGELTDRRADRRDLALHAGGGRRHDKTEIAQHRRRPAAP